VLVRAASAEAPDQRAQADEDATRQLELSSGQGTSRSISTNLAAPMPSSASLYNAD